PLRTGVFLSRDAQQARSERGRRGARFPARVGAQSAQYRRRARGAPVRDAQIANVVAAPAQQGAERPRGGLGANASRAEAARLRAVAEQAVWEAIQEVTRAIVAGV